LVAFGLACAVEQFVEVNADECGRHQAEMRQRRVAAADVRVVQECRAETILAGRVREGATWVRDRNEVRTGMVGAERGDDPTIARSEERERLDGSTGFGGDDEERLREIERGDRGCDGVGVRAVEDVEVQIAGLGAEDFVKHFWCQARAAHAEQ
jgi:hypothetical protein